MNLMQRLHPLRVVPTSSPVPPSFPTAAFATNTLARFSSIISEWKVKRYCAHIHMDPRICQVGPIIEPTAARNSDWLVSTLSENN